jgi:hypothetical protein
MYSSMNAQCPPLSSSRIIFAACKELVLSCCSSLGGLVVWFDCLPLLASTATWLSLSCYDILAWLRGAAGLKPGNIRGAAAAADPLQTAAGDDHTTRALWQRRHKGRTSKVATAPTLASAAASPLRQRRGLQPLGISRAWAESPKLPPSWRGDASSCACASGGACASSSTAGTQAGATARGQRHSRRSLQAEMQAAPNMSTSNDMYLGAHCG